MSFIAATLFPPMEPYRQCAEANSADCRFFLGSGRLAFPKVRAPPGAPASTPQKPPMAGDVFAPARSPMAAIGSAAQLKSGRTSAPRLPQAEQTSRARNPDADVEGPA